MKKIFILFVLLFGFNTFATSNDLLEDLENDIKQRSYVCDSSITFTFFYETGIVELGNQKKTIYGLRMPNDPADNDYVMMMWIDINTDEDLLSLYQYRYINSTIRMVQKKISSKDSELYEQKFSSAEDKNEVSRLKGEIYMRTSNDKTTIDTGPLTCQKQT
jgi:hypothetical protein